MNTHQYVCMSTLAVRIVMRYGAANDTRSAQTPRPANASISAPLGAAPESALVQGYE